MFENKKEKKREVYNYIKKLNDRAQEIKPPCRFRNKCVKHVKDLEAHNSKHWLWIDAQSVDRLVERTNTLLDLVDPLKRLFEDINTCERSLPNSQSIQNPETIAPQFGDWTDSAVTFWKDQLHRYGTRVENENHLRTDSAQFDKTKSEIELFNKLYKDIFELCTKIKQAPFDAEEQQKWDIIKEQLNVFNSNLEQLKQLQQQVEPLLQSVRQKQPAPLPCSPQPFDIHAQRDVLKKWSDLLQNDDFDKQRAKLNQVSDSDEKADLIKALLQEALKLRSITTSQYLEKLEPQLFACSFLNIIDTDLKQRFHELADNTPNTPTAFKTWQEGSNGFKKEFYGIVSGNIQTIQKHIQGAQEKMSKQIQDNQGKPMSATLRTHFDNIGHQLSHVHQNGDDPEALLKSVIDCKKLTGVVTELVDAITNETKQLEQKKTVLHKRLQLFSASIQSIDNLGLVSDMTEISMIQTQISQLIEELDATETEDTLDKATLRLEENMQHCDQYELEFKTHATELYQQVIANHQTLFTILTEDDTFTCPDMSNHDISPQQVAKNLKNFDGYQMRLTEHLTISIKHKEKLLKALPNKLESIEDLLNNDETKWKQHRKIIQAVSTIPPIEDRFDHLKSLDALIRKANEYHSQIIKPIEINRNKVNRFHETLKELNDQDLSGYSSLEHYVQGLVHGIPEFYDGRNYLDHQLDEADEYLQRLKHQLHRIAADKCRQAVEESPGLSKELENYDDCLPPKALRTKADHYL